MNGLLQSLLKACPVLGCLNNKNLLLTVVFALQILKREVLPKHKIKSSQFLNKRSRGLTLGIKANGNRQQLNAQAFIGGLRQDIGNTHGKSPRAGELRILGLPIADPCGLKTFKNRLRKRLAKGLQGLGG